MTLSELIDQLQELAEELNPSGDLFAECDPEIVVAYQPSWPMEVQITNLVVCDPLADFDEEYGPEPEDQDPAWHDARDAEASKPVSLVIGTSERNEYLRSGASKLLGWR